MTETNVFTNALARSVHRTLLGIARDLETYPHYRTGDDDHELMVNDLRLGPWRGKVCLLHNPTMATGGGTVRTEVRKRLDLLANQHGHFNAVMWSDNTNKQELIQALRENA